MEFKVGSSFTGFTTTGIVAVVTAMLLFADSVEVPVTVNVKSVWLFNGGVIENEYVSSPLSVRDVTVAPPGIPVIW